MTAGSFSEKKNDMQSKHNVAHGALTDANLAVNPNAVVEVTPFVRLELDLHCVGEAGNKSILGDRWRKGGNVVNANQP